MPRFSIVLPTRNRAFILRHAIASVLAQTHDDYELIVSDNSSSDETPTLVSELASTAPRVRYVRTPQALSMPASWEFALRRASGEWVLLLEDDGMLMPDALYRLNSLIDAYQPPMITFSFWSYFSNDVKEAWRRNTYVTTSFSENPTWMTSDSVLAGIRQLAFPEWAPRMYNCVVPHNALSSLRAQLGMACVPPAPDYSGGAGLLATIPRYLHLARPLFLSHCGKTSPGASMDAYHEFQRELGEDNRTTATPVPLPFVSACNIVPESIGRVQRGLNAPSLQISFDAFVQYFYSQMTYFESAGWEFPVERRAFRTLLHQLPPLSRLRQGGRLAWNRTKSMLDRPIRRVAWQTKPIRHAYERSSGRRVMVGADEGFHDFPGALQHMATFLGIR